MLLIDTALLATRVRESPEELAADDWAVLLVQLVTEKVLDEGLDVDEDGFVALSDKEQRTAKRVALAMAARVWRNPDLLRSEGALGPIGGDTFGPDSLLGLEFSEAEQAALDTISGAAVQNSGLWSTRLLPTDRKSNRTVYVPDGDWPDTADLIPFGHEVDAGAFGEKPDVFGIPGRE